MIFCSKQRILKTTEIPSVIINHMPIERVTCFTFLGVIIDSNLNERIRGTTKVGEISKKVQESRLKWYGHVLRREDEYVGKRVMAMEVPGKRRRGRPK